MKSIKTLLIILTAALFYTACQKDETPEVFDTISGTLSAGENVSAEDLAGLSLHLSKLHDGVDPTQITTEIQELNYLEETTIKDDGTFEFANLENGNYILFLSDEFMFSTDTFMVSSIDGKNLAIVNKSVDRVVQENFSFKISIDININPKSIYVYHIKNETEHKDMKISFYQDDKLAYDPIECPKGVNMILPLKLAILEKKSIRINCTDKNEQLLTTRSIEIPMVGTNTGYATQNSDLLKVKITSCIGYKNVTISY